MILCWGEVKATVGRIVQMRRGGSEAKPSTLTSASADPHVPLENSIATGRSAAEPRSPLSLPAPTPPYPALSMSPQPRRAWPFLRSSQCCHWFLLLDYLFLDQKRFPFLEFFFSLFNFEQLLHLSLLNSLKNYICAD